MHVDTDISALTNAAAAPDYHADSTGAGDDTGRGGVSAAPPPATRPAIGEVIVACGAASRQLLPGQCLGVHTGGVGS